MATANQITIGVAVPATGPDALIGDQIRAGVTQAILDLNDKGGLLGQGARLVSRDDGSNPKTGVETAKAFIAAKVPFVIGPVSSAVTEAVAPIYAGAGMIEITPSATAPQVTDRGLTNLFRMCGRDDQQAAAIIRYLTAHHVTKVAILQDGGTSGKALADAVRAALAAKGQRETVYGSLEKGAHDASNLVTRVKASGAQIAVWGGGGPEAALLAHQFHEASATITILGGTGMASDEFVTGAGSAADGTLIVFPEDPRTLPAAADLLRRLQANGQNTGAYAFNAYAAIQVLNQAVAATHSFDPRRLAATLHSGMTFHTVLGDLSFDAKGDRVPSDLAVYVWHRGANGRMTFDDLAKS